MQPTIAPPPKRILVTGVAGRPWGAVVERIGARGHFISHHRELPSLGSRTFDVQDYDLVAFGLGRSKDTHLPYLREMCASWAKTKLLLLGEPPVDLPVSEFDPWGKLAYVPESTEPEVLTENILECLDNDWLVWGRASASAGSRSRLDRLPRHLRPLLLGAGSLLRQVRSVGRQGGGTAEIIEGLLALIVEVLACEGSSFLSWESESRGFVLRASVGSRPASSRPVGGRSQGGVAGWVVERNCPLLVWDLGRVARFAHRPKRRRSGRSFVCLPVCEGEQLFGVLTANAPKDDVFTSSVMTALSELADDLGCALAIVSELESAGAAPAEGSASPSGGRAVFVEGTVAAGESPVLPWPELFRSLPLGIISLDTDAKVTFCNDRAAEVLCLGDGLTRAEDLAEVLGLDEGQWRERLSGVLDEGHNEDFFQVSHAGSPQQRWLHLFLCPRWAEGGEVLGALLVVTDVSKTAWLQQRLVNVERQALLGELASKVAHELNNALDGIMRFVSLALRKESGDERAHEYLEDARTGLRRMANVVARLLSFSRRGTAVREDVDLAGMIQEALRFFEGRAQEQGVIFEVDASDPLPELRHSQLFEVFTNLIKNALDVMAEGGRLTIRTGRDDRGGWVTFADTGPGIPQQVQRRVFEPFFTTKASGEGTGLGLAISHDIVGRCDGSIEVESEPGRGATFILRFPLPDRRAG